MRIIIISLLLQFSFVTFCSSQITIRENEYYSISKDSLDRYTFFNKGRLSGVADNERLKETSFSITIPNEPKSVRVNFGGTTQYYLIFNSKQAILILDNLKENEEHFYDSLSLDSFMKLSREFKLLPMAIEQSGIKLKCNRKFGIYSNNKFIICYLNVREGEMASFVRAVKSID